jgi:TolB-like protein
MSQNLIEEDPSLNELAEKKKSDSLFSKKRLYYTISIVIAFVVCYLVIGFIVVNKSLSKDVISPNSIAVLPFKDFSPEDSQWFSDGVSDNILHSLAQMKDLSVISFTSSSTYRDTDKQIPEIAKELRVSYILEGSVTLVEGKIKIIAQLIDSNDKHIWSKEYDESFDNVIDIQKNVAQEVMQQLEITLSSQEEVILEKFPTENMEAFNLHLRGRLIDDSRKKEDLEKNIELNRQAIALDTTFAEAYAEVAFSYYLIAINIDPIKNIEKSNFYADAAIKLNPKLSRAWAVKAMLLRNKDWEKTKIFHEKAIELNPNDALVHSQYAEYFLYRPDPDIKKSLEQLRVAQRLNPLSKVVAYNYARSLIINTKFNEAEVYLNKMSFLFTEYQYLNLECELVAYKTKDWTQVIPFLNAKIEKNPNNALFYNRLGRVYDGVLNDDLTALIYRKKAYKMDSTNRTYAVGYFWMLVEGKKFNEAKILLESENFKIISTESILKGHLWYYYYHQENYKKALEISKDSLLRNHHNVQAWTYAQLGDKKKVDSINKRLFIGHNGSRYWRTWKAFTYAILKEKDSMYYYLETARTDGFVGIFPNSRREFDPYRNKERFKAILRANYLPIPEE